MTISIDSTHPPTTGNNTTGQPSKLGKALRSLALGTAVGLGTILPTASAVAQEKPPENVPVQEEPRQEEQQPPQQQDELSPAGRWAARILGLASGAAYAYLRLKSRKKNDPA